eukprot:PITA_12889
MSLLQVVPQYCNAMNISEEGRILMQIKKMEWIGTNNSFSSWNATDESPCSWNGVFCDTQLKVVTKLNLSNTNISGSLSSTICGLQNLKELILPGNFFGGPFPYGLLACKRLQTLDLSGNLFGGSLPHRIHELAELRHLSLEYNNFSGDIPPAFGMLHKLETLSLGNNHLSGSNIPAFLGNLTHLQQLWMKQCSLEGEIPSSLGNLTELKSLDLSGNRLLGNIPTSLMRLSRMTELYLWKNQLSGKLPPNIDELRSIRNLDFSSNQLNGSIPETIVNLVHLESLSLWENNLTGSVPAQLATLVNLTSVSLYSNKLSGWLPQNLGTHSDIWLIDVSENDFEGPLPQNLCKGGNLYALVIFSNKFSGNLWPFDSCSSLQYAQLHNNHLSGEVPLMFWSSAKLRELMLYNNMFEGHIPMEIGEAKELQWLEIANNRFSGKIPPQIGELRNLFVFSASNNRLSGPLPEELADFPHLYDLNLANNRLTGEIYALLGSLSNISRLDLSNNQLEGDIPPELGNLNNLTFFNVSGNQLSGSIPASFKNLHYRDSFLANPYLCADPALGLRVRPCSPKKRDSLLHHYLPIILVPILVLAMAILLFSCLICIGFFNINIGLLRNSFLGKPRSSTSWEVTPFHSGLEVNGSYILKQLTEANVIGSGGAGKVYKACLRNGQEVAVKKISNRGNEFEAEVETLGVIRHSNILKLLCCISSAESDFKLLVFEYIENGSLFECLHGGSESMQALGWPVRHNIAVGVARGLCYLHHDCRPPILHRDVKSSNILVDSEFEAKIADFGVSKKLLSRHQPGSGEEYGLTVSGFTGSHGYIAPEYAYGMMKVNEKSDVYSFGVVLLELVSGKRATGETEYGESLDIVGWIDKQLICREEEEQRLLGVLDRRIIEEEDESTSGYREKMLGTLAVGLRCTNSAPNRRPSMKQVLDVLQSI